MVTIETFIDSASGASGFLVLVSGRFADCVEAVCVKNEKLQESFVEKLERVKKAVAGRFPGLEMRDFHLIMGRLAHYHYEKKRCLLVGESRELYDFLLEQGFHPFTVYRWSLLSRVHDDLRFQVRQGRV